MCTIISPFVMDTNLDKAARIAEALEYIADTIMKETEREDVLGKVPNVIYCIAENVRDLATEFEKLRDWAEDANIQIIHQRYHGKGTRMDVYKDDLQGPDVLLSSIKTKTKGYSDGTQNE